MELRSRDYFLLISAAKASEQHTAFLDYLVEDICGRFEIVGFFRHVSESAITACANDKGLSFNTATFTNNAVQHFVSCLVDAVSRGRLPGMFRSLLRAVHRSTSSRISPETIMADHIIPRVVQVFYSFLTLPSHAMASTWGQFKVSNQLRLVDALRDALNYVFSKDPNPNECSRSIVENAIYAKNIFLVTRFYRTCTSPDIESHNLESQTHLDGTDIHNKGHLARQSTVDLLFEAQRGGKPSCITDLACLSYRELLFILKLYNRAVSRGAVVDRQMNALASDVENIIGRIGEDYVDAFEVLGAHRNNTTGLNALIVEEKVESPGVHELDSAAWMIQAVRISLKKIRVENDFRVNENNLKELTALRDRFSKQSNDIACILRDFKRFEKYKDVLMEYRAQIRALIDRKHEEPLHGIGTMTDDNFMRYFTTLTFRQQDSESEIMQQSQTRVNMNFHFETEVGKSRKLPTLYRASQFDTHPSSSPTAAALNMQGVSLTDKIQSSVGTLGSMGGSIGHRPLKSASPLKVVMQTLFRTSNAAAKHHHNNLGSLQ